MILRIDRKTIYMYVQKGLIPCVRIQSNVRFDRREILGWIGPAVFHRWDADDMEARDMPARKTATQSKTSPLMINVFDGTRQPFPVGTDILYRVIDGNQKQIYTQDQRKPSLYFKGLPFYDNFGDNYTVIASSDGYRQAGFTPIKLSPPISSRVDLMLIPDDGQFNFSTAGWDWIKANLPFLANGVDDAAGRARYEDLMERKPASLAALLNITTAMRIVTLTLKNFRSHKETALDLKSIQIRPRAEWLRQEDCHVVCAGERFTRFEAPTEATDASECFDEVGTAGVVSLLLSVKGGMASREILV